MAKPATFIKCKLCQELFKRKRLRDKFCSQKCMWKGRPKQKGREPIKVLVPCDFCGKQVTKCPCHIKKSVNKKHYCNTECRKFAMRDSKTVYGFKKTTGSPLNPYRRCTKDGKFVYEHRWVMEQEIGRKLKRSEHVHHINGDQKDNRIDNLQLLSSSEHAKAHRFKML